MTCIICVSIPSHTSEGMKRFRTGDEREISSINMANVLMLLSRSDHDQDLSTSDRVFECKTCNRQFSSFQALGGHRASHKKPRLVDENRGQAQSAVGKPKLHECSICGLEFAIGQALGGHMRRHKGATEAYIHDRKSKGKRVGLLDLNLPPLDDNSDWRKIGLGLGLKLGLGHVDKTPMMGFL